MAYAMSAIASLDWPDQWTNLFDELMILLSSGESDLVHGAMRVLSGTVVSVTGIHAFAVTFLV